MKARFWGTRGSIPRPGSQTLLYGGNTSCVEVRSASGTLVIIDCGTGAYDLGRQLVAENQPIHGSILISHTHWDHIQGFPFFAPFFAAENEWDVYAPRGLNHSLSDTLAGQMQYSYFPVTLDSLAAKVRYHDLVEGVFEIGDIRIQTHYLNHPALTLGYRLEADGVAIVYVCDSEPKSKAASLDVSNLSRFDEEQLKFLQNADLVIHDGQYSVLEYEKKIGWGHSSAQYAADFCRAAGVKRLALTHHDPDRDDAGIDQMVGEVRASLIGSEPGIEVFAAAEGTEVNLGTRATDPRSVTGAEYPAKPAVTALVDHLIVMFVRDAATAEDIRAIGEAEEIEVFKAANASEVLPMFQNRRPSVLVLDDGILDAEFEDLLRSIAEMKAEGVYEIPVVFFSDQPGPDMALDDFVAEWLHRPVTPEYVRTRIKALILRASCRWARAQQPKDEEERITSLCRLNLLDSPREERFDRITRKAAETFDVAIALISLVDRERQWFKSVFGSEATETSRDAAFCAHAILEDRVLVVPDTLLDERFAENMLVIGGPRIRFYAGCPLRSPDGLMMGTLCLIDTRPRELNGDQLGQLKTLAREVELEVLNPVL